MVLPQILEGRVPSSSSWWAAGKWSVLASVCLCVMCHHTCVCAQFVPITWSLSHSRFKRPLLIDERRKCKPWSAIRKLRSPNQNTTLWETDGVSLYLNCNARELNCFTKMKKCVCVWWLTDLWSCTCGVLSVSNSCVSRMYSNSSTRCRAWFMWAARWQFRKQTMWP